MNERWSRKSMALHWGSAAIIAGLATAGFVMADLPPGAPARLLLSRLHTLFGLTLMVITVLRLVTRWRGSKPPPLPLPELHRRGIGLIHGLLYVALFSLGASGFATGLLSEWPTYLRGAIPAAPELEQLVTRQIHEVVVFTLLVLVALHVGGVVVHELRRGGALRRMVPFLK